MEMELWERVRHQVLVERRSKRSVMKEEGLHWKTLKKMLSMSEPPGYQQKQTRPKLKIGEYLPWIAKVLEGDKEVPRKQRHTAKRIWDRLKIECGFKGGYTIVKDAVRELTQHGQEVFVPLIQRAGTAQMDFGEALARIGGVLRKVKFFVMALPYSDAVYIRAYERECTESFWDGHVRAFEYFGGVPQEIAYDNTKVAVAQIIGGGKERKLTEGFLQLRSHYLFESRFCRVARGNEKGVVEGMVKFTRLNFMVPVPQADSMDHLNLMFETQCRCDLQRRVRGHTQTKAELLKEDQAAFRALPAVPFEACRKRSTAVNSLSLVRFDDNDYSVPVQWAHHSIVIKGFIEDVVLCAGGREVARHRRIWQKEQIAFEPIHYLALLERKPGALDSARPLSEWKLPECFALLRRRLESDQGSDGTKEYIRVLRLLETHSISALAKAITETLSMGATSRDLIAQWLIPREDWSVRLFSLDGHPHLRGVRVAPPDLNAYRDLVVGGAQ